MNFNPRKTLGAEYLAAVGLLTLGYRDAMPSPRRYVAITVAWFIMGLASQVSAQLAKLTSYMGGLILLGLLIGKAGQKGPAIRLAAWAQRFSETFAATPSGAPPTS